MNAVVAGNLAPEICARVARLVPANEMVCVALSGGLDSTVLLDVLAENMDHNGHPVSAVHVNHNLSPNAGKWVKFCERLCANAGVPLVVEEIRVDGQTPDGLEAAARIARYAVFSARPERYVALAHHLDDQAETVLLQLLRGTGLKGIAAMPEIRELRGSGVNVIRPLLDYPRAVLEAYAQERGLRWIEDESNASTRHDRNYLRHDVLPLLDKRFPGWRDAMSRFARHAGSANDLLEQLAATDGVPQRAGDALPIRDLPEERRANALRTFLSRNAVAMPSEVRLTEMLRQFWGARDDARVRIDHAGVSLVRYKGEIHIERNLASGGPWRVDWTLESAVDLGGERGVIEFEEVVGDGIRAEAVDGGEWYFAPRSGGESIRLGGAERPTKSLKNLFQELEVPIWQREKLPLLFHDGRLVWVPGIGIASEYACQPGQDGFRPSWRVAGKAPLC
ncbi:MAG TPA: tRNA lysidine(34) synthetase TilS [Usitatibacter sp.]|nr:tRNA lysidine(34) synthetase TilS [Usitatibacter sp.]